MIRIDPQNPDPSLITRIVEKLRRGEVIAYPTETFYGLGADAFNPQAVGKIFEIKGRDFRNPIAVIIGNTGQLPSLAGEVTTEAASLIRHFWPGPLTLLFKASARVLPELTAGTGKIGARVSSHAVARELANKLGRAITATSANLAGGTECTRAGEVLARLGKRIDCIVDGGETPGGPGSTVLDTTLSPPAILRRGAVQAEAIQSILGKTS